MCELCTCKYLRHFEVHTHTEIACPSARPPEISPHRNTTAHFAALLYEAARTPPTTHPRHAKPRFEPPTVNSLSGNSKNNPRRRRRHGRPAEKTTSPAAVPRYPWTWKQPPLRPPQSLPSRRQRHRQRQRRQPRLLHPQRREPRRGLRWKRPVARLRPRSPRSSGCTTRCGRF